MSGKSSKTSVTDAWGEFVSIPKEFTKNSRHLTDQARWLFVLLREYTNGESGKAFPSYITLQERTGWTPKTISRALKNLEEHGWLERKYQFGGVTNYTLLRPSNTSQRNVITNTSQGDALYFPEGSPILPKGTPIKKESTKIESKEIETSLSNRAESARSTFPPAGSKTVHATPKGTPFEIEHLGNGMIKVTGGIDPLDTDFGFPEIETPIVRACGIAAKPPYTPQAPDAQATLRTPHAQAALVNLELGEIKPASDSAGITASTEAIEPPSTPVSAKRRPTSRKPKIEKTAEELKISAGIVELMNFIGEKMGKIPNPAGQGKACKEMLKAGYPIERIKQELEIQLGELLKGRRRVVTWMTVQQTITSSVYAEQHKSTGGNNGKLATTDNDDLYAYCEQRSRLRENGEAHY